MLLPDIKSQIDTLNLQIANLVRKRTDLVEIHQTNCQHKKTIGYKDGNTGNWCEQDDSYWLYARCLDCDKKWYADSEKDDYLYRNLKFKSVSKTQYHDPNFTGNIWEE